MTVIKLADKNNNSARTTVEDTLNFAIEKQKKEGFTKIAIVMMKHTVATDGDEAIQINVPLGGIGINNIEALGMLAYARDFLIIKD